MTALVCLFRVWLSAKSGGILSSRHGGINPALSENFRRTLSEPLITVAQPPFESEETPPTNHKGHMQPRDSGGSAARTAAAQ